MSNVHQWMAALRILRARCRRMFSSGPLEEGLATFLVAMSEPLGRSRAVTLATMPSSPAAARRSSVSVCHFLSSAKQWLKVPHLLPCLRSASMSSVPLLILHQVPRRVTSASSTFSSRHS